LIRVSQIRIDLEIREARNSIRPKKKAKGPLLKRKMKKMRIFLKNRRPLSSPFKNHWGVGAKWNTKSYQNEEERSQMQTISTMNKTTGIT
jgi:hypothetical protein